MAETSDRQRPQEHLGGAVVERPSDSAWRADGLATSRHSRLADALRRPLDSHDVVQASRLCAAICREALADFAPALLLLPAEERQRIQVLLAFTLILFDFARQPGLEGERLSEINRWEFSLEQALEGEPPGQPIFVLMAAEERRRPWCREGLDRLLASARRRILHSESTHARAPNTQETVAAFLEILPEVESHRQTSRFGVALTRLRFLCSSGRKSTDDTLLPDLRKLLDTGPGVVPPLWTRPARYLQLAASRLLRGLEKGAEHPEIGIITRLALLTRARFRSLGF